MSLRLDTTPEAVQQSINVLSHRAMTEQRDAERAARFLLSLWNGARWPIDLSDLVYIDDALKSSVQHLIHFCSQCGHPLGEFMSPVQLRQIADHWSAQWAAEEKATA